MTIENNGRYRHSLIDYDGQRRQFSFDAIVITAANHDAEKTAHDRLVAAIADVTLGNLDFEEMVADREQVRPVVKAVSSVAQVNIEWVFSYVDVTTTSVYNVRIPTADIGDLTLFQPNTNEWDPADAKWVEIIAAFEDHVKSPDGNVVNLQKVVYNQ